MGNICRSPAGENIFRKLAADAGRSGDFEIDSAGTIDFHEGSPPDSRMRSTLLAQGFPVAGRARQIRPEDLASFDLVLTMDDDNLKAVRRLDREGRFHAKIRPLVEFCTAHDTPCVPDPYYGGQDGFEKVIEILKDGCRGILSQY
jgi:protein-tyrosine phosphatase